MASTRWSCTTSVCVDLTLRDGFYRDDRCRLVADCTGEALGVAEARTNHEATLLTVGRLFGWAADSAPPVAAFDAPAGRPATTSA